MGDCSGALESWAQPLIVTCYVLLGLGAVIGNTLIIVTVFGYRRMRTVSNCVIAILAVNDLLVGLGLDSMYAAKAALNYWETGSDNTFLLVLESASLQSTFACVGLQSVRGERGPIRSCHEGFTHHEIMTKQRCLITAITLYLASFLLMTGRFLVSTENLTKLWVASSVIIFVIPLNIITFCYYHIFKEARAQSRRIAAENTMASRDTHEAAKNKKAAYTVAMIIGLFFIAYSPASVISVLQTYAPDVSYKNRVDEYWFWFGIIVLALSTWNPLIYGMRSIEFRRAFKKLLRFKETDESSGTFTSQTRRQNQRQETSTKTTTVRVESLQEIKMEMPSH